MIVRIWGLENSKTLSNDFLNQIDSSYIYICNTQNADDTHEWEVSGLQL